ncbi:MarR family transcriptional regulator [Nitratireductor indicus C115]|uniref:MarR family transcriptional regulator n=1 Tax=Nitratireductor indicus C115 TaxID=1231190 RepID=K2PHE5_9HYPH|nr:MarR family transcriptional regulator [Nitratireductor indicus]EKF40547.1 MarR family transcriptional regulator [Nitratireductor indicus C115]SFQ49321.1 DNA-binding transcriptional regulator, MarR family [Nitratireductor indicus]
MINLDQKYAALLGHAGDDGAGFAEGMRLCFEVLALASAIDGDCAARLGVHGLSEGKFVLLFLLEQADGELSPHELAERAGVTRATVTGLLDGLERAGLVRRCAHESDRRKLIVQLTPKGRQLAKALTLEHSRWIGTLFSDFTSEERALLRRLLGRAYMRTDAGSREMEGPNP